MTCNEAKNWVHVVILTASDVNSIIFSEKQGQKREIIDQGYCSKNTSFNEFTWKLLIH